MHVSENKNSNPSKIENVNIFLGHISQILPKIVSCISVIGTFLCHSKGSTDQEDNNVEKDTIFQENLGSNIEDINQQNLEQVNQEGAFEVEEGAVEVIGNSTPIL